MEGSGSHGSSCGWEYPGAVRDPVAGFYEGVLWGCSRDTGGLSCGSLSAFDASYSASGLYHGNWIQGIYGFVFGLLLAWGYESSSFGKYRMVVLMHGAANGAAVLCSMVFSGLF